MEILWSKEDIVVSKNGVLLLNKAASKRFYEVYKDKIDSKYANNLFPVEFAQKAYNICPRNIEDILGKIKNDDEIVYEEYKKFFSVKQPDYISFFNFLYSISKLLDKNVTIDEMKIFGFRLNKTLFKKYEENFSRFVKLKDGDLLSVLNNECNSLDDFLDILNIVKLFDINSIEINLDLIDNWLLENGYYSLNYAKEFKEFIGKLSKDTENYYFGKTIAKYLFTKYDIKSFVNSSISIEEQIKIISNFDNTPEYLFKIASILNKEDGISNEELVNYAIFLKRRFKIDYEENSLKFFIRLPYENSPVQLTNLLDDAENLFDLLNLLQLPIIYNFEASELDMNALDNWFSNKKYYDTSMLKKLKTKFLEELKTCPRDYFSSQTVIMFLESKINELEKNKNDENDKNIDIDDSLKIVKRYKPVTDKKKKKLVASMLFGTGIIASFYLTIIKEENPINVISNCVSTFTKYGDGNIEFKMILNSVGDLIEYFTSILLIGIGGVLSSRYSEETEINVKKKVK